MEMATLIAEDNFLIDCFVHGSRMRELADAMALTSAAMVNSPTPAKTRNDGEGRLDLWDIRLANKNGNGA